MPVEEEEAHSKPEEVCQPDKAVVWLPSVACPLVAEVLAEELVAKDDQQTVRSGEI